MCPNIAVARILKKIDLISNILRRVVLGCRREENDFFVCIEGFVFADSLKCFVSVCGGGFEAMGFINDNQSISLGVCNFFDFIVGKEFAVAIVSHEPKMFLPYRFEVRWACD